MTMISLNSNIRKKYFDCYDGLVKKLNHASLKDQHDLIIPDWKRKGPLISAQSRKKCGTYKSNKNAWDNVK